MSCLIPFSFLPATMGSLLARALPTAVLLLAGWIEADACMAQQRATRASPNILLIMCDQLNARVIGCYGGDVIMRYPEKFRRQRCPLAVDLTDLMPTLLAVTGHAIPEQAQGQNLVPFVTGQRDAAAARPYGFSERVGAAPGHVRQLPKSTSRSFMVRGQGWKYIRFANAQEYLYHLAEDPGEIRNVAQEPDVQDIKKKMALALERWQIRTRWCE